MEKYEEIVSLANKAGYTKFTELQEKSFRNENFYDVNKWLFITGATSSGKTLIALLSYFYEYKKYFQEEGIPYKMLFAVPYRALASQKLDEIKNLAKIFDLNLRIVQSTSEHTLYDDDIIAGKPDIVIIINEKIFMFASTNNSFLNHYDLIVLDEIALVQDDIRGLKTDFILIKAKQNKSIRIIALGTPFYNWNEYIKKFNFIEIVEKIRPIEIKEFPVFYYQFGIKPIFGCQSINPSKFVHFNKCKNNDFRINSIIIEICKYHLKLNQKIIIFLNSRQDVRDLSLLLQKELSKNGNLVRWIKEEECKDYILKEIQAESENESENILYGIMDDSDYRAFACGITYHNADMPSTLRNLIERDILSEKGHLRIICSTETLAYGINSNADVVIIPRMEKYIIGNKKRFLYANEYMNYTGRAGRLRIDSSFERIGYVYPILNFSKDIDEWKILSQNIKEPKTILSKFLDINECFLPFYILSLFPNQSYSINKNKIKQLLQILPLPSNKILDEKIIENAIKKLLDKKLIYSLDDDSDEDEDLIIEYSLTDFGHKIAGYIISFEDFDKILNSIHSYIRVKNNEIEVFEVDCFYDIINTNDIIKVSKSIILEFSVNISPLFMKNIFRKERNKTSPKLHEKILADIDKYYSLYKEKDCKKELKILMILSAILLWRSNDCNPSKLYDNFHIYYGQMSRLMESISYRLDIIKYSISVAPSSRDNKTMKQELGSNLLEKAEKWFQQLVDEISYQPSDKICELLEIKYCDLYKIQKLRPVEKIFNYLIKIEKSKESIIDQRKNISDEMKKWPKIWQKNIRKRFKHILE